MNSVWKVEFVLGSVRRRARLWSTSFIAAANASHTTTHQITSHRSSVHNAGVCPLRCPLLLLCCAVHSPQRRSHGAAQRVAIMQCTHFMPSVYWSYDAGSVCYAAEKLKMNDQETDEDEREGERQKERENGTWRRSVENFHIYNTQAHSTRICYIPYIVSGWCIRICIVVYRTCTSFPGFYRCLVCGTKASSQSAQRKQFPFLVHFSFDKWKWSNVHVMYVRTSEHATAQRHNRQSVARFTSF